MFRVGAIQAVVHRHRAKTRRAHVQIREVQRGWFGVGVFNLAVFNLGVVNKLDAFPFLFLLRCVLFRLGEAVRDGGVSRDVHFRKRAQPRARSALLQPSHDVQHVDPPLVRVHAQPSNGDGHLDASFGEIRRVDQSRGVLARHRPTRQRQPDVAHRVSAGAASRGVRRSRGARVGDDVDKGIRLVRFETRTPIRPRAERVAAIDERRGVIEAEDAAARRRDAPRAVRGTERRQFRNRAVVVPNVTPANPRGDERNGGLEFGKVAFGEV